MKVVAVHSAVVPGLQPAEAWPQDAVVPSGEVVAAALLSKLVVAECSAPG